VPSSRTHPTAEIPATYSDIADKTVALSNHRRQELWIFRFVKQSLEDFSHRGVLMPCSVSKKTCLPRNFR
jgi:hypothetical protein